MAGVEPVMRPDLVQEQGRVLEAVVGPLIQDSERIVLVDFPNHGNVGDSAIWLGELALLRRLGCPRPCYVASLGSHHPGHLRRALGAGGTILIHGGGNFGDIWPWHQALRERILREFPESRIVQLPQTLWFNSDASLERMKRLLGTHPRFTLLVRDRRSLDFGRAHFDCEVTLCPDSAFAMGPLPRRSGAVAPVIWLSRRDREATPPVRVPGESSPKPQDWYVEEPRSLRVLSDLLGRVVRHTPVLGYRARPVLGRYYDGLASRRVRWGIRLLSAGRCVVTNRLHAHILCLQMGIRHFLTDNSYGKVGGYYETWTCSSPLTTWCASEPEALEQAMAWAGRAA